MLVKAEFDASTNISTGLPALPSQLGAAQAQVVRPIPLLTGNGSTFTENQVGLAGWRNRLKEG